MAESCPVIHKVTDAVGGAGGEFAQALYHVTLKGVVAWPGKCPVQHTPKNATAEKLDKDLAVLDQEFDEIGGPVNNTHPSLKQYRKLKRVMSSITGFYENGTRKKGENYELMVTNLAELERDLAATRAQLAALDTKPAFQGHPKTLQYREFLQGELESLGKKRESMEKRKKEFYDLHVWSGVINKVCAWLEDNLDAYALDVIPELRGKIEPRPVRELSADEVRQYSRGLDEITYNLKESQDFFQAAVDGRLKVFHDIEKEIVRSQMEALMAAAPDSQRTAVLMGELAQDYEYVASNDDESEEALKRKAKMLRNHRAYLKVLRYHTDKLKVLTDLPPPEKREYDAKWVSARCAIAACHCG